jgi:hypothetical protein
LFEYEVRGGHTHVTVRCGPQDHSRPKVGDLVMENEEWKRLRPAIVRGFLALANAEDRNFGPTEVEVREKERLDMWEDRLLTALDDRLANREGQGP